MFTIPAILVLMGGLSTFLGSVLKIVQKYCEENLQVWAVFFYVMAGIMAFAAFLEFIHGIKRAIRRARARRTDGKQRTLPKRKPRH